MRLGKRRCHKIASDDSVGRSFWPTSLCASSVAICCVILFCTLHSMKVVVQRVSQASVTVDGTLVSSIGKGIMVLVGIARDDTKTDAEWVYVLSCESAL